MANEVEQKPAAPAAATTAVKVKKKKLRPTNCVQSNKRIRRKDWYYRNGKYFANKQCFKLFLTQEADKATKAKEAKEADAAAAAKASAAPAGEAPAA